jgi:tetratricopeptide (TPR) repeat protein
MRSILVVLLVSLAIGCGGSEPNFDNQTTPNGGGASPDSAAEKPAEKQQTLSKETAELAGLWKYVRDAKDPQEALKRATPYEGRTLPSDAYFYLGLLYRKGEQPVKAAEAFRKFVDACPGDVNERTGLYYLVECMITNGNTADAVTYLNRFAEKFKDPASAPMLRSMESSLAGTLIAKGDLDGAVARYGKAFAAGDYYSGEAYVMGLWALGRYDEARTAAGKLGDAAPGAKEMERAKLWVVRAAKMGKPAPAISVDAWANPKDFSTDQLKGKVVLGYFWSVGSGPGSRDNEKALLPIYKKYAADAFVLAGFSQHDHFDCVHMKKEPDWGVEEETKNLGNWVYNTDKWLGGEKLGWALGLCPDDTIRKNFDYDGIIPTFFVIDKAGNYAYWRQGNDPAGYREIDILVGRLLKK